jgi:ribosomal protein S17
MGCTLFYCHKNGKLKKQSFTSRFCKRVVKKRENLEKNDKHVDFQVGDRVNIKPGK